MVRVSIKISSNGVCSTVIQSVSLVKLAVSILLFGRGCLVVNVNSDKLYVDGVPYYDERPNN